MKSPKASKHQLWISYVLSGLVVIFMLFDAFLKFLQPPEVVQTTVNELGFAEHHIVVIGILGLISTILYAIPKTSILGAILLTGYFGGAIAAHLRVDNPLMSHTLFPFFIAVLMWVGFWIRNKPLIRS